MLEHSLAGPWIELKSTTCSYIVRCTDPFKQIPFCFALHYLLLSTGSVRKRTACMIQEFCSAPKVMYSIYVDYLSFLFLKDNATYSNNPERLTGDISILSSLSPTAFGTTTLIPSQYVCRWWYGTNEEQKWVICLLLQNKSCLQIEFSLTQWILLFLSPYRTHAHLELLALAQTPYRWGLPWPLAGDPSDIEDSPDWAHGICDACPLLSLGNPNTSPSVLYIPSRGQEEIFLAAEVERPDGPLPCLWMTCFSLKCNRPV